MTTLILIGWYASGIAGSLLLWNDWASAYDEYWFSPRRIVLIVLGGLMGPILFIAGLIIFIFLPSNPSKNSWWDRPIR